MPIEQKNIKTQVKCNLQNISYHIDQYTSIIADLRREIERLKVRVKNQKEKSAVSSDLGDLQAERHQGCEAHSGQVLSTLRMQLVGAFREQMEMHRSLMELENTNTELHVDTCRHFLTIRDWEREKARGTCKYDKPAKEEKDENAEEEDREADIIDSPEPPEVTVARDEINLLLAEPRETAALKARRMRENYKPTVWACPPTELEQHLANAKEKASQMEEVFPRKITSEDQQEVLRLLCRAHELELGNTELQANTLYKENLLCQKDFVIWQLQQHTLLCEEIIRQQQMLIKVQNIPVPETLARLHHLHLSELEEGTLNRLLLLHSVVSSMLRPYNSPSLGVSQHLDLNKDEVRKGLPGNMKNRPWGVKFDIPSVTLESDSGSCRSSKTTPCRKEGSLDTHLSPTFSVLPKGPVQQQKPTGVVAGKMTPRLRSPTSLDLHGKKPPADIAAVPLSLETLNEIAANTESISLIAASRRSRAQHRDLGSKVSSAHFSEEDLLELKYLEINSTPDCQTRDSASTGSLLLEPAAGSQLCSPDRGVLKNRRDQEVSAERTARKISLSQTKLPQEGTLPEVLPKDNAPASTIQQSNADHVKGRVLPKQVKGPADGASNRQKQQQPLAWGTSRRLKRSHWGSRTLYGPKGLQF